MANVVCRSLGFAGGSIYTFGATRLLPTLPIVAGFKTCAGTESNIFQCGSPGTMTDVGGGAAGFSNGADDPDCWIGCRGADGISGTADDTIDRKIDSDAFSICALSVSLTRKALLFQRRAPTPLTKVILSRFARCPSR